MAQTGIFHHIGTLLIFASMILLLVTTISAPVVNDLALLKVKLANATTEHDTSIHFGTFGFCTVNTLSGVDFCSKSRLGYDAAALLSSSVSGFDFGFSNTTASTVEKLTKALVLHPVATGLAFIAFLLGAGSGVVGSFLASMMSLLACLVAIAAAAVDFVLFSIVRHHVNNLASGNIAVGFHAEYGVSLWTLLAGAICSLLGALIIFLACCSARFHESRATTDKVGGGMYSIGHRRFW